MFVVVGCFYPFPRASSSMCLFTKILNFHTSISRRPHQSSIRRYARVSHQRDINLVISKRSRIEQTNLAAAPLCDRRINLVL